MKTKNRNTKTQKQWYERQHRNFNNEDTPNAAIFSYTPFASAAAAFAAAVTAASDIDPNVHLISLGLKINTELSFKGKINNMADNDTINTTPVPDSPDDDNPEAAAQDDGSTDSNFPYSLRNRKFSF